MRKTIFTLFILAFACSSAFAMTYFLTRQYYQNGSQMCEYGNGTVLNVGMSLCPLSING